MAIIVNAHSKKIKVGKNQLNMDQLSGGYGLLPPGYPSGDMPPPQSPVDAYGSPLAPQDNGAGLGDGNGETLQIIYKVLLINMSDVAVNKMN